MIGLGNVEMLAIPRDAPPRQLAGFAGIFLFERPFDAPVVRQVQQPPLAVIKIGLREGNAGGWLAFRPHGGRIRRERIGRRQNPVADDRVIQVRSGFRHIALEETPAGVQGNALARRIGVRGENSGGHQKQHGKGEQSVGIHHNCDSFERGDANGFPDAAQ